MSKKIGWFGMQHPCDEECPSGISRLAARTSPQIPAEEAQGGKAGGTGLTQTCKNIRQNGLKIYENAPTSPQILRHVRINHSKAQY